MFDETSFIEGFTSYYEQVTDEYDTTLIFEWYIDQYINSYKIADCEKIIKKYGTEKDIEEFKSDKKSISIVKCIVSSILYDRFYDSALEVIVEEY